MGGLRGGIGRPDPAGADRRGELRRRYRAAFEAYAEAFTAAVLDAARAIDGLTVPVKVKAETDPEATWWDTSDTINPADDDQGDALVWHLWATARDQVALPTLDDSIDHSRSTEEYR